MALAAPLSKELKDDGLLTTSEIADMKLTAELVILSACNAASLGFHGAPGLTGLSRAFFYAGARGVLVSHWRIDDEATAELVSHTVELRSKGDGKAIALPKASSFVISNIIETAHPRFWAAFTLIGDPK